MSNELPRVRVYALGGTIASTATATASGVTPQLGASDLVAAVPQLASVANVEAVSFRQVPSGDLTMDDLVELAREISSAFDSGVDGVVVTQGTDTIEETSFALDLLVAHEQPVVVTGAMRNPTLPGADGPANIVAAVRVAGSPFARGLGTVVVMNDEIHAARFVRKTHTQSTATFRSPTIGPLGWLSESHVRIAFHPSPLRGLESATGAAAPVALYVCTLDDDDRLLRSLDSLGYAGVVVEAFGGGHVPARLVSAFEELAASRPTVLASRVGAGEVLGSTYGFPGSETDLLSRGLLSGGALDARKARVALRLALAASPSSDVARERFTHVVHSVTW